MRVKFSQLIKKPLAEVFAFAACYDNDPSWSGLALKSEQLRAGPPGVGTTLARVEKFAGHQFSLTAEIIEYVPNYKSSYKSISGRLTRLESRLFEEYEEGTCLTLSVESRQTSILGLPEWLAWCLICLQLGKDLKILKNLLENAS